MLKLFVRLFLVLASACTHAQDNPVIHIDSVDRSNSAIVVTGVAKLIPPGTKMWISVQRINGKSLSERQAIKSGDVVTGKDGTFVARLTNHGSLDATRGPAGTYQLEFYARFSHNWQTAEVARIAGVEIDSEGKFYDGNPLALPKSKDLVIDSIDLGSNPKPRVLQAMRTVSIKAAPLSADGHTHNTSRAMVVINDPKVERNPVRSIAASTWKAVDIKGRLKPKVGQDIAIWCEGKFPLGAIADDLYSGDGSFKRSFVIDGQTTVMDLCNQMEDIMRTQNPRLFK